ncbi:MAG: hypothetical protein JNN15_13090 [Blastocatellia bacterium]|nr:hypothetical protein [Blastocatellia bacterium]
MIKVLSAVLAAFFLASTAAAQQSVSQEENLDRSEPKTYLQTLTIPENTPARLSLKEPLSSKLNEVGDEVFAVLEKPIIVDGRIALKKGTEFQGRITEVEPAGKLQKQSKMAIVFEKIIVARGIEREGDEVELRLRSIDDYAKEEKLKASSEGEVEGGRSGRDTLNNVITGLSITGIGASPVILASSRSLGSAIVVSSVVLGSGAAAGVLLTKGKEIRLEPGTVFRVEFAKPFTVVLTKPAANWISRDDD